MQSNTNELVHFSTVAEKHEAQVALLHDPHAFAQRVYGCLFENAFSALLLSEEMMGRSGWEAGQEYVKATADAGGDVIEALRQTSDTATNMLCAMEVQGIALGVAFEQLRRGLLQVITEIEHEPRLDGRDRANIEQMLQRQRSQPFGDQ